MKWQIVQYFESWLPKIPKKIVKWEDLLICESWVEKIANKIIVIKFVKLWKFSGKMCN